MLLVGVVVGEAVVGYCPTVVGVGPAERLVLEEAVVRASSVAAANCSD